MHGDGYSDSVLRGVVVWFSSTTSNDFHPEGQEPSVMKAKGRILLSTYSYSRPHSLNQTACTPVAKISVN